MKKRILVIGITMAAAGSEKAFLSFASGIDYDQYEVDLLLAAKEGAFLPLVPKEIRILDMGKMGELFLIDKNNASRILAKRYLAKNPLRAFKMLPYIYRMKKAKTERERVFAANRLWLSAMETMKPFDGEYDMALAYWGDRTMFYMVDKVKAKRKIAWLHFDYDRPPREDALYLRYFERCDKVITVSKEIERSLKKALPVIADKVFTVENRIDAAEIRQLAAEKVDDLDEFSGVRLATVGRLCPQKGYDLALPAVARLVSEGVSLRWDIVGEGDEVYKNELFALVKRLNIEKNVRFLGQRENPYPYMAATDIYIQPSRHEGKPIAVEEAKALHLPILVTNYTSAAEQTENGKLGLVADISEEGIYRGLKMLIEDASLRERLRNSLSNCTKKEAENDSFVIFSEGF